MMIVKTANGPTITARQQQQQQQQLRMVNRYCFLRNKKKSRLPFLIVTAAASAFRRNLILTGVRALSTTTVSSSTILNSLQNPKLLSSSIITPSSKSTGKSFPVTNPANPDEILAYVPVQDDVRSYIEQSDNVLSSWRDETTALQRSNLLTKWSTLIQENSNDIATIMTLESGKPIRESIAEVNYARSFLDYYAGEAIRPNGFLVPTPFVNANDGNPKGHIMAIQQPVGVTALITPWNFPLAMITRKVAPALAVGCTCIVKPSELTPLSALALQYLAIQAGIPLHVYQTITPDTASTPIVGKELCTNQLIRKISFTGSTNVGKQLMEWSSNTIKRLSLELGGNAPFIVFDDADINVAIDAAIASKFRNAGQTCVCADRFLIHTSIYNDFIDGFCERVKQQFPIHKIGPGIDDNNTMGPLITDIAVQKVHQKVQDAINKDGAKCILGGNTLPNIGPNFYTPTILTDVSIHSDIWKTETFGPVAAVRPFDTEEEALQIANNSYVGLASYFCTKDLSRIFRFSNKIESGLVGVNEGVISTCVAPFGGVKESGLGREGSPIGLQEYVETKYIFINT